MADPLRNEVAITLDGTEYTLRATFAAIRGIERDLRTNLIPLIDRIARSDVGLEQCAIVISHGLRGYGDTSLTVDEIGELVLKTGVGTIMGAIIDFLGRAMEGVSLGKLKETEAAPS
jgi:hypothetical protein